MWGYKIIRHEKEEYGVTLRHGALYPTLNNLEKKGFLRCRKEAQGGRVRKVYEITSKGLQLVDAYSEALQAQVEKQATKVSA
jgi:DNA-binding PadR family transcriptional regulator